MPELPPERVALLKATLPPSSILPVDLFSRGTDMQWDRFKHVRPDDYIHDYPEILDLKVSAVSGSYDVVGVTNWRSRTTTRRLSFAGDLGLPSGTGYVAFDFWGQKPLGVFTDAVDLEVEPHDTRVVLLHPLGRPQLIGTSRHITGARPSWRSGGTRRARPARHLPPVPGEEYALFVHVPAGTAVSSVRVESAGQAVATRTVKTGALLTVRFTGTSGPAAWRITFGAAVPITRS